MNVIIKSKSTRLLSAFLAILMVTAMLPVTVFAWTAEEGTKCTSTYGDLYLGSDGNNYYSKAGNTLFYNDDGSFYVSYHNGGVARYKYLMIDSIGKEKAIHSKELEKLFMLDGRNIRRKISALRQDGFPICSDETGYYYADNQKEINHTVCRLNELVTKVSNARTGLLFASVLSEKEQTIEVTIKVK